MNEVLAVDVCIVGTGFAGIAAALALRREGRPDFVLLERAKEIGGTWRDNRYPGCACDVPSHLYSLSTELHPDWTRRYATSPEIHAYLRGVFDQHELGTQTRFGADVREAAFDEGRGRWRLRCVDGLVVDARVVFWGVGALRDPRVPELPGLGSFEGQTMHSARWRPEVPLEGRRVGVVGTGASAIQVVPAIAGEAGKVEVFQRTPAWVIPRRDRAFQPWERWIFRHVPGAMRLRRLSIYLRQERNYHLGFRSSGWPSRVFQRLLERHVRAEVADPELARQLTPTYQPGCKRVLVSDDWFPAMQRGDVALHGDGVAAVHPDGVELSSGERVPLDVIVWCTGFKVDQPLGALRVEGVGGRDLAETWGRRPRAWLGVTVPGFPNSFLLLGPNSALGHTSVVIMIEAQVRYAMQALRYLDDQGPGACLDVRPERVEAFLAEVDAAHDGQVWASGCQSWYLNEAGENYTVWPGGTLSYLWRMRRFDPDSYRVG